MYLKRDKFLVVGISRSGIAITETLLKRGAKCYVYDDSESETVKAAENNLAEKGATVVYRSEVAELLNEITVVVLSPGIPIDHDIPVRARKLGKRITGELDLASEFCLSPIIAVTGTNGKTTTCTMIENVLSAAGIDAKLCGNAGTPLSSVLDGLTENSVAVCETSSFQLETAYRFYPHIAVVTNVTPDHLSRHYNMENYVYLKKKILSNLRESEYAVLNYDDPTVKNFGENTRAKVVYFSAKTEVNGAYVAEGKVFYKGKYITDVNTLPISGEHNVLNLLATVCVAEIMGVGEETIVESVRGFKGVKHRIQYVRTLSGVDYFNDSKATNSDATIKAIDAMTKPTILILGGKDKGLEFKDLFSRISNSKVRSVVLTGESRERMFLAANEEGYKNVSVVYDFEMAVEFASMIAEEGDAVLLSPACSSFDRFADYEERGNKFIELVESL